MFRAAQASGGKVGVVKNLKMVFNAWDTDALKESRVAKTALPYEFEERRMCKDDVRPMVFAKGAQLHFGLCIHTHPSLCMLRG